MESNTPHSLLIGDRLRDRGKVAFLTEVEQMHLSLAVFEAWQENVFHRFYDDLCHLPFDLFDSLHDVSPLSSLSTRPSSEQFVEQVCL
jgi:hypothetical protein